MELKTTSLLFYRQKYVEIPHVWLGESSPLCKQAAQIVPIGWSIAAVPVESTDWVLGLVCRRFSVRYWKHERQVV